MGSRRVKQGKLDLAKRNGQEYKGTEQTARSVYDQELDALGD